MDAVTNHPLLAGQDGHALDQWMPLIYPQLQKMAHRQLRHHSNLTLNTTMLVHESYLKLYSKIPDDIEKSHLMAILARVMRQVLIDYVREKQTEKRGSAYRFTLFDDDQQLDRNETQFQYLNEALDKLESIEPKLSTLVELRFFAGFSLEQVADMMDWSNRTAARQWSKAKAFLELHLEKN